MCASGIKGEKRDGGAFELEETHSVNIGWMIYKVDGQEQIFYEEVESQLTLGKKKEK